MIEVRKQMQVFGVAYDAEREELQIAARNDFYAGYRTMKLEDATGLAFGIDKTSNLFDTFMADESLRNLEELKSGENVLVITFEVSLDYDTVQPSYTKVSGFTFVGSELKKRED